MGEAKRKQESFAKLLARRPGCVYCAGAAVGKTIEHMPPRSMFEGRQRTKGMEFPACDPCNRGTKHSDLVAALLGRSWPASDSAVHQSDFIRLLSGVSNNVPGLLQEMHLDRGAEKLARKRNNIPLDTHPLRADGPILSRHIFTFAAKIGFALHYEIFGAPIPDQGGAEVMWFSNLQAYNDQIPSVIFEILPTPITLEQGSKSVADQFQYSYARTEEGRHMLYYASFNKSFAVAGVTALDRTIYLHQDGRFPIFVPGAFCRSATAEALLLDECPGHHP